MDQQGHAVSLWRLEGYKDRMAHRPGRDTTGMKPAEVEAYEQGTTEAERAMGFRPTAKVT